MFVVDCLAYGIVGLVAVAVLLLIAVIVVATIRENPTEITIALLIILFVGSCLWLSHRHGILAENPTSAPTVEKEEK